MDTTRRGCSTDVGTLTFYAGGTLWPLLYSTLALTYVSWLMGYDVFRDRFAGETTTVVVYSRVTVLAWLLDAAN